MWIENQSVNSAFALARQGTGQCPTHFSQATGETRLFRRTLTCPLYRSDMPQTQKGSWFLHYREKMDANLIEGIKGLLYEIWHTRERIKRMKEEGREPPKYLRKYFGNPMKHSEKYLLINQAFAGKQRLMPFFNRQNNEDLILAIQMAGVSRGRNGFQKQKAGEKLAETEEDLLEHRTDGSDAYDTLYIGCEKFPLHDVFAFDAGV